MSACKTGCGSECAGWFCDACDVAWRESGERRREEGIYSEARSSAGYGTCADVALVDFCNRVRAERQARRQA